MPCGFQSSVFSTMPAATGMVLLIINVTVNCIFHFQWDGVIGNLIPQSKYSLMLLPIPKGLREGSVGADSFIFQDEEREMKWLAWDHYAKSNIELTVCCCLVPVKIPYLYFSIASWLSCDLKIVTEPTSWVLWFTTSDHKDKSCLTQTAWLSEISR